MKCSAIQLAAVAALACCLSPTASAQLMRPDVPDQDYQNFASDPLFDSVVGFRFTDGDRTGNGTGVYLGNGWLLTAGHIVRRTINDPFYTDFSVVTGGNNVLTDPGYSIDTAGFIFHPDFQSAIVPGDLALYHDPYFDTLGLIAATLSSDYTPTVGDRMEFATYGTPGVVNGGFFERDGILRAGENLIRDADTFGNFFDMRMDNPLPNGLPLEMGLTNGASGSPIFFNGEVVGLANYASFNPNYGQTSGVEILSTHYDWIQSVIVRGPDFNNDGQVNLADLNILLANFGQPGDQSSGDADGNGSVDLTDLNIVLAEFGT